MCIYDLNVFDVRRLYLFHLFFLIVPNEICARNALQMRPQPRVCTHYFQFQIKSRLLLSRKKKRLYLI